MLKVAVPWALSHYIPLHGFHPLYRALFDHAPNEVKLIAWDNVSLYERLASDHSTRNWLRASMKRCKNASNSSIPNSIARKYEPSWFAANRYLTSELIGDLEFHHTVPFPSLRRPFVLYCETFEPLLFPFGDHRSIKSTDIQSLREHYRRILSSDLCLGIVSHVPETLSAIRRFVSDSTIEPKMIASRIGLSAKAVSIPPRKCDDKSGLGRPIFVFIDPACQTPANFARLGGQIVLRFWKHFMEKGHEGLLVMRCTRPREDELKGYGVDASFVRSESGRTIRWSEGYLYNHEMNALMERAHFVVLPSRSLHSALIMQAMSCGAVPVVTDTVGTSVFVRDGETGLMLKNMRDTTWHEGEVMGAWVERDCTSVEHDEALVAQMMDRIERVLEDHDSYRRLRNNALRKAAEAFSGQRFSSEFWGNVTTRYMEYTRKHPGRGYATSGVAFALSDCTIRSDDWERVFDSPSQPLSRIKTGSGAVFEVAGTFISCPAQGLLGPNDWSVCAQYMGGTAPPLRFGRNLMELNGAFLERGEWDQDHYYKRDLLKLMISEALEPFPLVHRTAALIWRVLRRVSRRFGVHVTSARVQPEVKLIREGLEGYNVVLCDGIYYAIPQCEGEFLFEKARSGGYSSSFSDCSLEVVLQRLAANKPKEATIDSSIVAEDSVLLGDSQRQPQ